MRTFLFLLAALFLSALPFSAQDSTADWRGDLARYARPDTWLNQDEDRPVITPEALDEAIEAAGLYVMNQQYSEGNFHYGYDFTTEYEDEDDNQVRQAGALWCVCNLNRERFTEQTRRSALLGIDFYLQNQRGLPETKQIVVTYKTGNVIKTGMVALFCISLTDFLTGQEKYLTDVQKKPFLNALENNLRFLQYQELPSGSWREDYNLKKVRLPDIVAETSPYFDGEALLAYLFAAKFYRAHPEMTPPIPLEERILYALPRLLQKYTVECFRPGGKTDLTKGFYQWGCMCCAMASELFADPAVQKLCLDGALSLTWWQLYDHRLDLRNGNTGYAVEGLVSAYVLARKAGLEKESQAIREAVDNTLARLMTWQVGGPFQELNPFFRQRNGEFPQRAFGGITSTQDTGYIRIDVVQHQLHAMMLARKYIYQD